MTKDEMKNRISMALKDSTLQQGFEIICKNLSEFEKENVELKTKKIPQLERKIASIRGAHSVDCRKLNARTEQVERLKKENAELKQLIEWLDMAIDSDIPIADKLAELEKKNAELKEEIKNNEDLATVAYMQGAEQQKKKYDKWLIKGKELLNEFMRISKASDEDFEHDYTELIGETETFLKEVSE